MPESGFDVVVSVEAVDDSANEECSGTLADYEGVSDDRSRFAAEPLHPGQTRVAACSRYRGNHESSTVTSSSKTSMDESIETI